MDQTPDYSQLLKEGYRFNIGEHLGNGWKLFSKGAGSFIGFTLVFFILYFAYSFLSLTTWPPLIFAIYLIITPLNAGVFIFIKQLKKDHEEFSDFFRGFQSFGQLTLFTLVMILISIPFMILVFGYMMPWEEYIQLIRGDISPEMFEVTYANHMANNFEGFVYVMFLMYALMAYIGLSYSLVIPLIVESKLGFWQAMETSRKIVAKKFLSFFALALVTILIVMVSTMLTCGLASLVAFPFMACVIYSSYDGIFSKHTYQVQDEIDTFGSNEGDDNWEFQGSDKD